MEEVIGFHSLGIKTVKSKEISICQGYYILHGHEYFGSGGMNPARWLYERTGVNSICGHFHRMDSYRDKSLKEEVKTYTMGCLASLHPDYMPYQRKAMTHVHGIGHLVNGEFDNIQL